MRRPAVALASITAFGSVMLVPVSAGASVVRATAVDLSPEGRLVVADRTARGLTPFTETAELDAEALSRARQMIAANVLSHDGWPGTPSGYCSAGENLASGASPFSAEAVNHAWLSSPEHAANIVNPGYTALGVAEVTAPSGYRGQSTAVDVWVTEFAGAC